MPASDGKVEHPTYRDAIDPGTRDAEADDAASEHIHDYQHPVTAQEDRFTAKQVDTPEAILRLGDEVQPRWAGGAGVAWLIVFGEHATHDILVDLDAEGQSDLLAMRTQPKRGLRRFSSTIAAMSSADGPLGPGLQRRQRDEKSR